SCAEVRRAQRLLCFNFVSGVPPMNSKPEITSANFPALHAFLRGYFHEDAATGERIPVAREWQQLLERTHSQPAALNAALKKLGSAIRLSEEEIPQVSAIFARCLAVKSHRRVANE